MSDTERWKREAVIYGWEIIREAGGNPDHESCVTSDGVYKYLHIYDKGKGDTILSIQAPTYYDLMVAARGAVNVHHFIARGF